MDQWNTRQHRQSGLTQRVQESPITEAEAEQQTIAFLNQCVPAGRIGFLKRPFPSKVKVLLNLRGVNHARPGSRIGDFSGHSSARGTKFQDRLPSRKRKEILVNPALIQGGAA